VYFQGRLVALETEYSDGLLQFMLKARRPERFKERSQTDVNAKVSASITVQAAPEDAGL
jgi:hypothetical protein